MTFHLLCLIHCCYILRCCSTLLLCSLLGGDLTLRHRQSCLYITSLPIFPNLPHHKNQSNLPSSSFSHLPHPPILLILPSSSSPHPPHPPSPPTTLQTTSSTPTATPAAATTATPTQTIGIKNLLIPPHSRDACVASTHAATTGAAAIQVANK